MEEKYLKMKENLSNIGVTLATTYDEFVNLCNEQISKNNKLRINTLNLKYICNECGNEFVRIYSNILKKDRGKECNECLKKKRKSRLLTLEELSERLSKKGLKLISDEYFGETHPIQVMCSCGNVIETTYASIRNSSEIFKCNICKGENARNTYRVPFEEIVEYFKNEGCELLSDESEYINIFSEVKFIAKCGHKHKTTIQSFKNSKHKICLECIKVIHKGENAYNWKGGYRSEREKFHSTYEAKKWLREVYKRDNYTCQCCGKNNTKLNAHHLNSFNWDKENRADVDNGVTLCKDCHVEFHKQYGYGDNTKEQYEEFINLKKIVV